MRCPACGSDDLLDIENGYRCMNCGEFLYYDEPEDE